MEIRRMSFAGKCLRLANGLIERICFLLGGITGAQIPGFISHYVQRLGGHLDEARRNVETYRDSVSPETLAVMRARVDDLQNALNSISSPNPFSRFYAFMNHLDYAVARNTLENYVPNLPVTVEGVVCGLIGAIAFSLVYQMIPFAFFRKKPAGDTVVGKHPAG